MDMAEEALTDLPGLSRATISCKVQRGQMLPPEQPERAMGIQALTGQVQVLTGTESTPESDAAKWLATWLAASLPALVTPRLRAHGYRRLQSPHRVCHR